MKCWAACRYERRVETGCKGLCLLPADIRLAAADVELVEAARREYCFADALAGHVAAYDYVLVDCPPSLGLLTINALTAAHSVLVPIQSEYYALEGVTALMNTISRIQHSFNKSLQLEGVVLTMFDGRTNLSLQVAAEVKRYFKSRIFTTIIPRNVRLGEAPSHGQPIHQYDARSVRQPAVGQGIDTAQRIRKRKHEETHWARLMPCCPALNRKARCGTSRSRTLTSIKPAPQGV